MTSRKFGGFVVSRDEEPVAVMAHAVFDAVCRGTTTRKGSVGRSALAKRTSVVEWLDRVSKRTPGSGCAGCREEGFVLLEVDQLVGRRIGARDGGDRGCTDGVPSRARCRRASRCRWPRRRSPRSCRSSREHLARAEVLDPKGERLGPARVVRPGEPPVIGAHVERAEPQIALALGQRVQVEEHFFRRPFGLSAGGNGSGTGPRPPSASSTASRRAARAPRDRSP